MYMKKILYIIPGYRESLTDSGYQTIKKHAREKNYSVILWEPQWKYQKMSDWVEAFRTQLRTHKKGTSITVVGFSFGAMIALLASQDIPIKKVISCSLSPYFKDDIPHLPPLSSQILGQRRMKEFTSLDTPAKLASNLVLLVGRDEWPLTIQRSQHVYKKIKALQKHLSIIPHADHDISSKYYLKEVISHL